MKRLILLISLAVISCKSSEEEEPPQAFSEVEVEVVYEDSISIRAIEVIGQNVAFAGSDGAYGLYNSGQGTIRVNRQLMDSLVPEFRAVASTSNDFFMLSVGNPALLFKTGDDGTMDLVYREDHENVFYDALTFWNDREGIGMGDPVKNCLSVIITRDGGQTWEKLPCEVLPETVDGEAAFAASDSNIAVIGDETWIISGGMASRVFYSPDKGKTWEVFDTPLVQGEPTQGGYTIDFYDEKHGIIFGGDYTNPENNTANKAFTNDGGRTWRLISDGEGPGYKSAVRYVPGRGGEEVVAVGFTGIAYSADGGESWSKLSDEGFYTIRFVNDTVAYAAGKNRLARLGFK